MAPSGHSSSSHSSHSHSSHSSSSRSSSSSSRSYSSSRSSGSSSRSYSSSRSSGGSFGLFGAAAAASGRSSSRGPSTHSSSSHSSAPASQSAFSKNSRPAPPPRSRRNQPEGFRVSGGVRPSYFRGVRHDYVYYPVAWTDENSGTSYESGYYDENGQRYDSVAFEKNGTYENVVCKCEYCGQDAVVNLKADEAGVRSAQCPNCGAPMAIRSELDETASQAAEDTHTYASEESLREAFGTKKKRLPVGFILLVLVVLLGIGRMFVRAREASMFQQVTTQLQLAQEDSVYLHYDGSGAYSTVSGSQGADKTLVWDATEGSYYDVDSDCWLWFNTEVDPPLWQYWYEGISSDFGEYGWMEHDADGWWIERSYGDWIKLPDRYDTSGLWYIED